MNTAMSLSRYLTGNSANCGKNAALPMVCTALSKMPAAPAFVSPAHEDASMYHSEAHCMHTQDWSERGKDVKRSMTR